MLNQTLTKNVVNELYTEVQGLGLVDRLFAIFLFCQLRMTVGTTSLVNQNLLRWKRALPAPTVCYTPT